MIETVTVWHGPVYGLYADEVNAAANAVGATAIDCATSSVNDLSVHIPDGSMFAEDHNLVWLRGLHNWKADDVTKAIAFFTKHPDEFDLLITSDSSPTVAVSRISTKVHDYGVPKGVGDYAAQIERWLHQRGHTLDKRVAATLVDKCSDDPPLAQQVAVTISTFPTDASLTWADIEPVVNEVAQESLPVWELGRAITTGSADKALDTLQHVTDIEPFGILRYLENRYRMILLALTKTNIDDIREVSPKVNDWVIRKTLEEARGMTPKTCSLALADIAATFALLMDSARDEFANTALEQCVIKLANRHALARA